MTNGKCLRCSTLRSTHYGLKLLQSRPMHLALIAFQPDPNLIPLPFFYVAAGLLGAVIGSFLNVVIHRLPREESIVFPNSRCPSCGAAIAFYDNLPVLSYVALRGRCRSCKAHISARYPLVELLTGLLWLAVILHDGLTWALPFDLIFVTAILALIFIDAEHMILPNAITYPGIAFALIARATLPLLIGQPHFDDLPMLLDGPIRGMAAVARLARRRGNRCARRWRLIVADGMVVGKTTGR